MAGKRRRRNKIIEHIRIESLGYGGVGIATGEDGKKILVKGALPDSLVDIKIVKKRRDYVLGHIVKVHEMNKKWMNRTPKCPHYFHSYGGKLDKKTKDAALSSTGNHDDNISKIGCGGCKWQGMSYERQLELKQDILKSCFLPLKSVLDTVNVLPVIPSPQEFCYRNKIEFSFGKYLKRNYDEEKQESLEGFEIAEHWQLGFHKQGEFSKIVDVDQCYLVSEKMHSVYTYIKEQLQKSGLPVYDAMSHLGLLRHLVIREGVNTHQIMVNLALSPKHFEIKEKDKKIRSDLMATWKKDDFLQENVTTLVITENDGLADTVRGQDISLFTIWGEGRIFEELRFSSSILFQISPFSFFQTNTHGAEVLFSVGTKMLGSVKGNLIDLYCGSGTIGLSFLKLGIGKRVIGIDVVESAIQDAKVNAKRNGLQESSEFICGRVELVVGESAPRKDALFEKEQYSALNKGIALEKFLIGDDVVVIDPPREGLHPKVVDFLIALKKKKQYKLLYISCNPTTMARDIALFVVGGFTTSEIQPVDMFPQTHHVECVALLE